MKHRYRATVAQGGEEMLADELHWLGVRDLRVVPGGVLFEAPTRVAYRVLYRTRIASRVLFVLRRFPCPNARALYGAVRTLPWEEHIDVEQTLRVSFSGTSETLRNEVFSAQRVKDAVVDRIREMTGDRPSVDIEDPDVNLVATLERGHGQIAIDLAGVPLHVRGNGREGGPAPLKESLAALILALSEWPIAAQENKPLYDPFCGSGSLLIEAAGIALGHAAGRSRTFAVERWKGFDPEAWASVIDEADRPLAESVQLSGSDVDPDQIARARRNAERNGLADVITFTVRDAAEATPPEGAGLVVTNPPYGHRLDTDEEAAETLQLLGDVLKQRFRGWHAWILAGSTSHAKTLGLKPKARIPLRNGPLDARLLSVPISDRAAKARRKLD